MSVPKKKNLKKQVRQIEDEMGVDETLERVVDSLIDIFGDDDDDDNDSNDSIFDGDSSDDSDDTDNGDFGGGDSGGGGSDSDW